MVDNNDTRHVYYGGYRIAYALPIAWFVKPRVDACKTWFCGRIVVLSFKSQQIMNWLATGKSTWTSSQLRLWNEVSTIILFAIVFLVIFRSAVDWIYGVVGLLSLAVLLMILIKLY